MKDVAKTNTVEVNVRTLSGLENVLAGELKQLGFEDIKTEKRNINARATWEQIYRANIWSRLALRILVPLKTFYAKDEDDLYRHAKKTEWSNYMTNKNTFAIDCTAYSRTFTHSKYASLKIKDALVDQFKKNTGERPNVDTENPDLRIHLHIKDQDCTLSLDTSGDSLHKRGYRVTKHEAPLNEVLAAGMLKLAGWNEDKNLYVPFCGSATMLIEAAMMASNTPPNPNKKFGFMKWLTFDKDLFEKIKSEIPEKFKKPTCKLEGSDISNLYVLTAQENIKHAGMEEFITLEAKAFKRVRNKNESGILVANPPYGERLMPSEINTMYKNIGDVLKKQFTGYNAWILSSNSEALKSIGLKATQRLPLMNGALECRYNKYELYEGSQSED